MEIKRATIAEFTINASSFSNEDEEYEYIQLNDNEFQFGMVGDVLTNYAYLQDVIEDLAKGSMTQFQKQKDELIRKVDHAMCSINGKEYDEAMSTLKDVMVQLMSA